MPFDATFLLRLYANVRLAALAAEDPAAAQARQLLHLVRRARDTRFGRDHGFASIRSVADYQARVPLRRYGELWAEYWSAGWPVLDDVTWPGRTPYFAFTSGTASGTSKFIPVSREMVAANRRAALDILVHHVARHPDSRVMGGKTLILGGSTDLEKLAGGVWKGDLSGIATREVPAWARPWSFPPPDAALDPDWDRKIDRLAGMAAGEDIRAITGTPGWVLAFLDRLGRPAREVFPRLELYVHGGVSFAPYRARFDATLGGAATREVYPASEGFVAVADLGPGEGMRLLADNGLFFEFVPLGELDSPSPTRAWLGDVRAGVDYAIVLTSCAGLWSYVLGDTVRLVDRRPPRLLVTGRTGWMLNAFGEHLSGEQLDDAMVAAARGAAVTDYAAGAEFADGHRGRHVVVVEFSGPPPPDFARSLDAALAAGSLDYAERRAGGIGLEAPRVLAVPAGFFAGWMRARGRLGGQNKVPRVITDEAMLADLVGRARDQSPREAWGEVGR
ncbi:MAG: GH3 auxin-responsive promoter family protein [Pseudomonadota bacterium]